MIFDTHCDTLNEISTQKYGLRQNRLHIDLQRASKYDGYAQFFAAWIENEQDALKKFNTLADIFENEITSNSDIAKKCLSFDDLKAAYAENKIAAFLSLEGAYFVNSATDIDYIYSKGVRCASLTWNGDSILAGGVDTKNPLTALGKELIPVFEQKGIILDASHLNENSFWGLTEVAKKPFIASHSCSKALCGHPRNLTDEQFLHICRTGGCVGVNFYSLFLSESGYASTETLVEHIKHFKKIGSIDAIGLGSDFDGVDTLPNGITGIESMASIEETLSACGFTESETDKITHLNFERVVKEILR